jgi:hypothetical protein
VESTDTRASEIFSSSEVPGFLGSELHVDRIVLFEAPLAVLKFEW